MLDIGAAGVGVATVTDVVDSMSALGFTHTLSLGPSFSSSRLFVLLLSHKPPLHLLLLDSKSK